MKISTLAILLILTLNAAAFGQTSSDATLTSVRAKDANSRDANGKLLTLAAGEHIYRGDVYMTNRVFPSAREHYDKILVNYQSDSGLMPRALFGMARSNMWERNYDLAVAFFDDLTKSYPYTKEGREGMAFKGASLVRAGKHAEAAKVYEQYIVMYPNGERVESAFLNVIDALRDAGKENDARNWIQKTRVRFPNSATETNAVFAGLRLEIGRKNWNEALKNVNDLKSLRFSKGAMTNQNEVNFLRGYILEKLNRKDEAISQFFAVPDNLTSYYGALATERLQKLIDNGDARRTQLANRQSGIKNAAAQAGRDFPALFRDELMKSAAPRRIDPRFVLAIMKQESSFNTRAKSPAAARGLLQLTFDTALKYTKDAGITNLQADDLYRPSTNIALGSVYLAELQKQFPNLAEAVAASYNGGEDNAARWRKRADTKEPFLFSAEVGFAESKDYVFKVLGNYRAYREIYTENLVRR